MRRELALFRIWPSSLSWPVPFADNSLGLLARHRSQPNQLVIPPLATRPCLALAFVSIGQRTAKRAHRIGLLTG